MSQNRDWEFRSDSAAMNHAPNPPPSANPKPDRVNAISQPPEAR